MSPPTVDSRKAEKDAILEAAKFMLVTARTAPKTGGIDDILGSVVFGREKDVIADKMEEMAEERKIEAFRRDAKNVRDSDAIILIGARGNKSANLNCGACGFENCKEFDEQKRKCGQDFTSPTCIFKGLDLGIALGSAARTASMFNVDNRIMYRIGVAAMKLGSLSGATLIIGIPVSAHGKNIYFDRSR